MLGLSNVIGCFRGSGEEKNILIKSRTKFVMDMCRIIRSVDYKKQNLTQLFLNI